MDKSLRNILIVGIIVAVAAAVYYLVYRPIQKDKDLKECLYSAGFVKDAEWYKYQNSLCIEKYGK